MNLPVHPPSSSEVESQTFFQGIRRLTLRALQPYDAERLDRFYNRYKGDLNLAIHHPDTRRRAVEAGRFFGVFQGEDIVAASGIFPVGNSHFREGGNTLVDSPYRRMGLHTYLILARVVCLFLHSPYSKFVVAVDPGNDGCYSNIAKDFAFMEGFPSELLDHCGVACKKKASGKLPSGRRCCCDFFVLDRLGQERYIKKFDHLLGDHGHWVVLQRDGSPDSILHIDLDYLRNSSCLRELKQLVRAPD